MLLVEPCQQYLAPPPFLPLVSLPHPAPVFSRRPDLAAPSMRARAGRCRWTGPGERSAAANACARANAMQERSPQG